MTITTQEWTMEPEPGDENYRSGRVERLKQWLSTFDYSDNRR